MAVNNELQDLNIAHQQNVELYKNNLASRSERIYRRGVTLLRRELLSYADSDNENRIISTRMRDTIERALLNILTDINREFEDFFNTEIENFTESEQIFYNNTLNMVLSNSDLVLPVTAPAEGRAYSLTRRTPINLQDGRTGRYLEELRNSGLKANRYIRDNVRRAFTLGLTISVLSSTLFSRTTGLFNSIFRSARTTANLLGQHATSTTRTNFYESNREIIRGYKWVSVLDQRTSDTCQYLSERVWIYDNPQASSLPGPISPPAHYNCRSTTTPILKSYREMDPEILESQEISRTALIAALPAGAVAGTTYLQWLQRQPREIQEEVLGAARYELWRSGELEITGFYSRDARFYTLEELDRLGVEIPQMYLRYVSNLN